MKKTQTNLYLSLIVTATALTAIIWLTAGSLQARFDVVNEKYFAFFYPWQTRNPTTTAYITAWLGYAVHQIAAWGIIWAAQRARPGYDTRFRWFNWAMVGVNLAGFFYMFALLSQSVLLFNRAHLNKWWTFSLETLVLVHGTLVAIYQGKGLWPMFLFGFAAMIVLTQVHGLGLSRRVRWLLAALRRPYSGSLLTTRFFFGLAFSLLQTIFALYALRRFDLAARDTGLVLTYVGVLSVVVQGYLVGKLTERFRDDLLISLAVVVMAFSLLGWAWVPSVTWLLVVLAPIAAAGGLLNTLLSSALTKAVHQDEVGGILGLGASLDSATRIIAPIIGGALIERLGTAGPGLFGAVIMAGLSLFVWKAIWNHPIAAGIAAKARSAA